MYKVGQMNLGLVDAARRHWLEARPRPLSTVLWYPAADDAEDEELLFGGSEPLFRLAPVARDAPWHPGRGKSPLVLLSHGTGGSALQMGWLARHLCMHGYVCAAVNHHGNNSLEPYLAQGFLLWWERASDLSALLDQLLAHPDLGARIDPERIGAAGFSLGGYTVIAAAGGRASMRQFERFCRGPDADVTCDGPREFPGAVDALPELIANDPLVKASFARHEDSFEDRRLRAAFAMNPALAGAFTTEGLASVDVPMHIVACEGDTVVPAATNACRYSERIPGAGLTLLNGALDHYVFLAEATETGKRLAPFECIDPPPTERSEIHARVAGLARDFLDRHLGASA